MSRPPLHIVAADEPVPAVAETVAARVRRLQAEAKQLAADHARELIEALRNVEAIAQDIAVQGEPYLPGVVNEARLQVEEAAQRIERLTAIIARAGR